ncbi:MAG TPA: hypothetical protein PK263_02930 [bacterium]|nr:hypothetical protein [bacterium]
MLTEKEIQTIKQLLGNAEHYLREAKTLLSGGELVQSVLASTSEDGRIIEGVFDGEFMVGSEGKRYPIPSNYASKSKLVAGDVLKLTILSDGTYVYKQVGPIQRKKIVGILEADSKGRFVVIAPEGRFRVLPASISYFKAEPGDSLTILVPADGSVPGWAAVENLYE